MGALRFCADDGLLSNITSRAGFCPQNSEVPLGTALLLDPNDDLEMSNNLL